MLNMSWAEMLVIAVVGLLVIGPQELPAVIRACRNVVTQLRNFGQEMMASVDGLEEVQSLKREMEKVNNDVRHIVDLQGNLQPTYDLDDVMGDILLAKEKRTGVLTPAAVQAARQEVVAKVPEEANVPTITAPL